MIGAVRTLTQLFAYEIPLFLAILAPALLADTWSLSEMTVFYSAHPAVRPVQPDRLRGRPDRAAGQAGEGAVRHPRGRDRDRRRELHRIQRPAAGASSAWPSTSRWSSAPRCSRPSSCRSAWTCGPSPASSSTWSRCCSSSSCSRCSGPCSPACGSTR